MNVGNVYARHLSDAQRTSDGFNDGSNQARVDVNFNPACDPQGVHTSDNQHSTSYCTGWSSGYVSTWNSLHPNNVQQMTQTQLQTETQMQSQRSTCIAIICNNRQSGSQDQSANQGQMNQP